MNRMLVLFSLVTISTLSASYDKAYASSEKLSKAYAAHVMIEMISSAIDIYKLDTGKYPSDNEGLEVLIKAPNNDATKNWHGPYLKKAKIPIDPWGNPFIYKFPGENNKKSYDLFSTGIDGVSQSNGNDEDDINNWQDKNEWIEFYRPKVSLFKWFLITIIFSVIVLFIVVRKHKQKIKPNKTN